jgi:predicted nucleotidyltransferase
MNLARLRTLKPQILAIAAEHGVGNIRVFGSVARGDADEAGDVDFLVTVEQPMGWDFYTIEPKLEEIIGCEVDVITDKSIHPRLRERILSEATPL